MTSKYRYRCSSCGTTRVATTRPMCRTCFADGTGRVEMMTPIEAVEDETTQPVEMGKVMCPQCDMAEVRPGAHCKWCETKLESAKDPTKPPPNTPVGFSASLEPEKLGPIPTRVEWNQEAMEVELEEMARKLDAEMFWFGEGSDK